MTRRSEDEQRPTRARARRAPDPMPERLGVGALILAARAAAGLSQAQLAERIGSSQPMVARWESGAQLPSVRSLLRIAEASGFELALGLSRQGSDDGELQLLGWARAAGPRRKATTSSSRSRAVRGRG